MSDEKQLTGKPYEGVWRLRTYAAALHESEAAYEAAVERIEMIARGVAHSTRQFDKSLAYKAFRRLENEYFAPYTGDGSFKDVIDTLQAGKCFPRFPYVWLPAGDHAGWWDALRVALDCPAWTTSEGKRQQMIWIVKEMLIQSGRDMDEADRLAHTPVPAAALIEGPELEDDEA